MAAVGQHEVAGRGAIKMPGRFVVCCVEHSIPRHKEDVQSDEQELDSRVDLICIHSTYPLCIVESPSPDQPLSPAQCDDLDADTASSSLHMFPPARPQFHHN